MPEGKNVIWCASFQLAWDRLAQNVFRAPPAVAHAEEVVSQLNGSKFSEDNLPGGCYFATAGLCADGIVGKIDKEMQRRFRKSPRLDLTAPSNTIVAYGYLEVNTPFRVPFFENNERFVFCDSKGKQTNVTSFGIRRKDEGVYRRLRDQVRVLYAAEMDARTMAMEFAEFVLDPCCDSSPNQIILACVKPAETLRATVEYIEKLISSARTPPNNGKLDVIDVLLIPNMAWNITHHFAELEGPDKQCLNKGFEGNYITNALQIIRFRLDRSGAELASEAAILYKGLAPPYYFNRPFVIYVKKRGGTTPFFVMYVDNAELLSKP
jgi:hypothetical protein